MNQEKKEADAPKSEASVDVFWVAEFVRRDFKWIVMCLLVLLVCMYTLYNIVAVQQKCNAHWEHELERCSCACPWGQYSSAGNGSFIPATDEWDPLGIVKMGD